MCLPQSVTSSASRAQNKNACVLKSPACTKTSMNTPPSLPKSNTRSRLSATALSFPLRSCMHSEVPSLLLLKRNCIDGKCEVILTSLDLIFELKPSRYITDHQQTTLLTSLLIRQTSDLYPTGSTYYEQACQERAPGQLRWSYPTMP